MVIYNVGKMIGRQFISALIQHLVVEYVGLDAHIATNHIVYMDFCSRFYLETNNVLFAIVYHSFNFLFGKCERVAHLHSCTGIILEVCNFVPFSFQFFWSVECYVCFPLVQELVYISFIDVTAFALAVRAMLSAESYTLVELNSQPMESLYDIFFCTKNKAI